jgi:hypothetical protein
VDNKSALAERVVQIVDRFHVVNVALNEEILDRASRKFSKFVLHWCYLPPFDAIVGNSLMTECYTHSQH